MKQVTPKPLEVCVYDTNKDGDCQHCVNKGGCKNLGGPFTHRMKHFGKSEHSPAGWTPK